MPKGANRSGAQKNESRPVARARFEDGYLQNVRITWADTERGQGPIDTAIRTGRPGPIQNLVNDSRFTPSRISGPHILPLPLLS